MRATAVADLNVERVAVGKGLGRPHDQLLPLPSMARALAVDLERGDPRPPVVEVEAPQGRALCLDGRVDACLGLDRAVPRLVEKPDPIVVHLVAAVPGLREEAVPHPRGACHGVAGRRGRGRREERDQDDREYAALGTRR
jgi:hypothetical protein